jgi:phosphoribosyl 1,2-cyclic phosphate phosphodiesterase
MPGLEMTLLISKQRMVTKLSYAKVRLLGTGTSTGVPVIDCSCPTCTSTNPKDNRLRCAAYLEVDGTHILIDVGPDFRQQALRYAIPDIDAVLITHHHFDHVSGMDDLRPYLFKNRTSIPCHAVKGSADEVRSMFSYIFRDGTYPGVPRLRMHDVTGPFEVQSRSKEEAPVRVIPIPAVHGSLDVLGYRVGNFAYMTDVSEIPFASRSLLEGLEVLVLDGLRDKPHPMHLTIDQSIQLATEIGAKQTWFTHIAHDLTHSEIELRMPEGMAPAYDGLECTVSL